MNRFKFARLAIAIIGIMLLITGVAVDTYRDYVNYYRWMLDYPRSKYVIVALTIALMIFGRFPIWLALVFLLVTGFLQMFVIADSWGHIGRIAHGDDYGVFFVYAGEIFFLIGLVLFTVVFHLAAAVMRASCSRHEEASDNQQPNNL